MNANRRSGGRTRGFTLIELLVVIAIIGVLIALLLPAIQAAREAARRSQCTNNLKQIGLGLHNYQSTNLCFPMGIGGVQNSCGYNDYGDSSWSGWTAQTYLLPFVEQAPLYSNINFAFGSAICGSTQNTTAYVALVNVYLCPSDPNSGSGKQRNNYYADLGTSSIGGSNGIGYAYTVNGNPAPPYFISQPTTGMFSAYGVSDLRDCTDGTSNTVCFSESLAGKPNVGNTYRGNGTNGVSEPSGASAYNSLLNQANTLLGLQACTLSFNSNTNIFTNQGVAWGQANTAYTLFNHLQVPNDTQYTGNSCRFGCAGCGNDSGFSVDASSAHSGGVNALMTDGSVRFIKNTIARITWQQIGTKAGNETISGDAF